FRPTSGHTRCREDSCPGDTLPHPCPFRTAPKQFLHACFSWATLHDLLLRFPAAGRQNIFLHRSFLLSGGTHGSNRKHPRRFADGCWNREKEIRCDLGRRLRRSGKEGRCLSFSGKRDAGAEHPPRRPPRGGGVSSSFRGIQATTG